MKKRRVLKTWSKHNVPEELCSEILSRIPVKSLLRFRCVCSSWCALIDDPSFTRLHLTRFNDNHGESHLLFFHWAKYESVECVLRCSRTLRAKARLSFLQTDLPSSSTFRTTPARECSELWFVSTWTDGLFMLKDIAYADSADTWKLMLWNPSIRKTRSLSLPREINYGYFDFGLGFDQLIEDYKFVRFVPARGVVSVYTVGTNSWKTIDYQGKPSSACHLDDYFPTQQRTFCLRGVLYALAGNQDHIIMNLVSFDLSSEMFSSTPLPIDQTKAHLYSLALTVVDGGSSLAVVGLLETQGIIWVLESLGDDIKSLSWTQRYSFILMMPEYHLSCPRTEFVYLKKNGEMLFEIPLTLDKSILTSYSLETQKESILLKRISLAHNNPWPYMESLILL